MALSASVRLLDDAAGLLARAASRLSAGSGTSARHLIASAGRQVDDVLRMPNVIGTPTMDGRVTLTVALEKLRTAHSAIGTGAVDDAAKALQSGRFWIDNQLPYGARNLLAP